MTWRKRPSYSMKFHMDPVFEYMVMTKTNRMTMVYSGFYTYSRVVDVTSYSCARPGPSSRDLTTNI